MCLEHNYSLVYYLGDGLKVLNDSVHANIDMNIYAYTTAAA